MIAASFQNMLTERFGPDGVRKVFYLGQLALAALVVGLVWLMRSQGPESGFAVREADRKKKGPERGGDLAQARIERKGPLQLGGIRIDGPPHEVLGIAPGADARQIQQAFRERMKQYHPDKVGRPGTREWTDAQKIAEAINLAKNEMLKRLPGKK